jgi:hypothetical protein
VTIVKRKRRRRSSIFRYWSHPIGYALPLANCW